LRRVAGKNRWFASADQRFTPDNILVDARDANFISVTDKASGKIVLRLS
jgi:hypothetical protein